MEMTKQNLIKLLERKTYSRFVHAYDFKINNKIMDSRGILDEILIKIKEIHPQFFNDYESYSIVINDTLQKVVLDYFREKIVMYPYMKKDSSVILFQSRLIKNCIKEVGFENKINIDEEMASMFTWDCMHKDKNWFLKFSAEEFHMGGYGWKEDIMQKWTEFSKIY